MVASATVWAIRRSPDFFDDFWKIWSLPWGKQITIDFYGLEVVLVLFMLTHATGSGTWVAFWVCAALMPVFGASAAAAYWLVAVA